ncbi:MAG: type II methionyl aminopeptidase [Desulfurococcales archaeon]|nr:type II methionyl aminopeptidase [Desulfurococcales archaeon]
MELGGDAIEKLIKAGDIARRTIEYGKGLIRPGRSAREICETVEKYIYDLGGMPAFPCNLSVDHVAAHYTPGLRDDVVLREDSVVKLDIGVSVDGYIADTAVTIDLSGMHEKLLEASKAALDSVVSKIRPGISLYEIGKIIESTVRRHGYKVIRNLTGHNISRYTVHAGLSIPNYPDRALFYKRLKPGMQVAIEPFATNGKGLVKDGSIVNIYSYTGRRPKIKLNDDEEKLLKMVVERYYTLPFTPRWLRKDFDVDKLDNLVKSLEAKGSLHGYPILEEAAKGLVSQFEHTIVILKDEVLVITCKDCRDTS